MSVATASQPSRYLVKVLRDLAAQREMLVDPDGRDPALSDRGSSGPDALELNAACLALPDYARELGVAGTPLLWSWPGYTYTIGQNRRDELLQAAALLVAAVERIDMSATRSRPELRVVDEGQDQ